MAPSGTSHRLRDMRRAGQRRPATASDGQRRPATASDGQRRPATASDGQMYAALAIIVAGADPAPAVSAAQKMLSSVTSPRVHVPGHVEFAGGWQEAATLTRALQPPDRARLADAMTAVFTDTDEPAWNRQLALAALATVGRHLSDPDRDRFFPIALQAARGELEGSTDDDPPQRAARPVPDHHRRPGLPLRRAPRRRCAREHARQIRLSHRPRLRAHAARKPAPGEPPGQRADPSPRSRPCAP